MDAFTRAETPPKSSVTVNRSMTGTSTFLPLTSCLRVFGPNFKAMALGLPSNSLRLSPSAHLSWRNPSGNTSL